MRSGNAAPRRNQPSRSPTASGSIRNSQVPSRSTRGRTTDRGQDSVAGEARAGHSPPHTMPRSTAATRRIAHRLLLAGGRCGARPPALILAHSLHRARRRRRAGALQAPVGCGGQSVVAGGGQSSRGISRALRAARAWAVRSPTGFRAEPTLSPPSSGRRPRNARWARGYHRPRGTAPSSTGGSGAYRAGPAPDRCPRPDPSRRPTDRGRR